MSPSLLPNSFRWKLSSFVAITKSKLECRGLGGDRLEVKWFKHMSATRRDERIASLIDEHGFEGYGFFWAVLEVIAEQMPPIGDKYEVGYSLKRWSQMLDCHPNKAGKYLRALGVHGLVSYKSSEGRLWVGSPNLLKYRDEYSKKSRQGTESRRRVASSEGEGETEGERETNSEGERRHAPRASFGREGEGKALSTRSRNENVQTVNGDMDTCAYRDLSGPRHKSCRDPRVKGSLYCLPHKKLMAQIQTKEVSLS